MPRFNLAQMIRRARPGLRRRVITLREIAPPAVMATDLFRSCYLPIVHAWERALPRIMAEYERTLGGMVADNAGVIRFCQAQGQIAQMITDAPADVQREIGTVEGELQRLLLELTPRLRDWALRVEGWTRGKWRGAILSATGIDIGTIIGPEDVRETVEAVIERNVALIKDVGAQAQSRIADAVFRGLNQRRTAREVAAEIREAVAMSRRRSLGIASHQMSDLSNRLADERRREAGITTWGWRHSGKLNYRPEHKARNGKVYGDTAAAAKEAGVLPPPDDRPGALPYCGCRSRSVITFD